MQGLCDTLVVSRGVKSVHKPWSVTPPGNIDLFISICFHFEKKIFLYLLSSPEFTTHM